MPGINCLLHELLISPRKKFASYSKRTQSPYSWDMSTALKLRKMSLIIHLFMFKRSASFTEKN